MGSGTKPDDEAVADRETLTAAEARRLREVIGRSLEGLIRASEGSNVGLFETAALAAGLDARTVDVRLMRGYLRLMRGYLRLKRMSVHSYRLPVAKRVALRALIRSRDHLDRLGADSRIGELSWLWAAIGVPVDRGAGGEIAKFVEAKTSTSVGHVVLRWKDDGDYLASFVSADKPATWTRFVSRALVFESAAAGRALIGPQSAWFRQDSAEFVSANSPVAAPRTARAARERLLEFVTRTRP